MSLQAAPRVCIVGAGPCGLATLKAFKDYPHTRSWDVVAFEAKTDVGGVWVPDPHPPVPPSHSGEASGNIPSSPIYDSLTTNLPHHIMAFYTHAFPDTEIPLFPPHQVVRKYIRDYAERFDLLRYVRFGTRVTKARFVEEPRGWRVRSREENGCSGTRNGDADGEGEGEFFDYLLVCAGHYNHPRTPAWEGLPKWENKRRRVIHSIYYRNPDPYKGQTVLVVGDGPSARDISAELEPVAKQIHRSFPCPPPPTAGHDGMYNTPVLHSRISRFDPVTGHVRFEDGSVAEDVDTVLAATGYEFVYDFLRHRALPALQWHMVPTIDPQAYADVKANAESQPVPAYDGQRGGMVGGKPEEAAHDHPSDLHDPSPPPSPPRILFLGAPSKVAPFPLFEVQAIAATRMLAGKFDYAHPSASSAESALQSIGTASSLPTTATYDFRRATTTHVLDDKQWAFCDALAQASGVFPEQWSVRAWVPPLYAVKASLREAARFVGKQWKEQQEQAGMQAA
ncbi:uncharacterized protein EV422DRAFT_618104 [Fimicolochytrium jonesii]|uniref:uncharacterized protein n=1 Tax=Fimicolochytrium jonesii TaxID=1396493 RepID=UPI0022FF41B5|nr:uncharacterized protein EV422DRAFT_618104 [Fimicolochytrium jonesii]KAI8824439.1 hypothetical protein EV422DRAFT_618104 [Fimicolochytrium jonesii]